MFSGEAVIATDASEASEGSSEGGGGGGRELDA